ncbi:glucans biosynthesis glucosyltransferase MdoH [Commensalibacter oyaizuii]|uniref:Glucans biosynthesis glucosyltransferase H n=1 Tax=Commensalibacter oyaizuii TaxID=3043873 RepID=A0ABT6PYK0_9PROT|nr:glucans biosynthesis glucosyltransferase MdoH [Commensalibacter sp. TBRC 16381]MDI2089941.1 glucans biosynthesis glucosyltransferase MdoH [Commensalibacter sp. TBRC 16381]
MTELHHVSSHSQKQEAKADTLLGSYQSEKEFDALPPESPIEMPVQDLRANPNIYGRSNKLATQNSNIFLRRLFVFAVSLLLTGYASYEMNLVFNSNGMTLLGAIVLVIFTILFLWIAFSFASSLGGFVEQLKQKGGLSLGIDPKAPLPLLHKKTAVLMPTYNEDPHRVLAGLKAIYDSIQATGRGGNFDFFILSDTTNPDVWVEEEAAFLRLREQTGGHHCIFYRRRFKNTDRKAGNLAEWIRRFGGAYDHMLTLDADSLMEGDTIVRICAAMEAHEGVGLIQTLPVIVNGTTLFARLQQFAGRVYGPTIAYGLAWWHGSESNYWGHNAVIRIKAFAEQAGMPHLPARRKPFGGMIMSHDFVEAALMRRGRWAIHMVPALHGSYEESPPSLTDIAVRDRRWCQGNLQHAMVIPTKKLSWISRIHMMVGIGAYVMSPLWLLFLLVGILVSLQALFIKPEYFTGNDRVLFPNWPQVDPVLAKYVFILTMLVLLAPKFMAWIALLFNSELRRGCGGAVKALSSIFLETIIGGLIAPIAMLIQTTAVISILLGYDSGWNAQRRDVGHIPLKDVIRDYWRHMAFGIILGIGAWEVSASLFFWMTPVLLGLLLAIPLVWITSSQRFGSFCMKIGLLIIPEEMSRPDILRRDRIEKRRAMDLEVKDGFSTLAGNKQLVALHLSLLPSERKKGDPINPHYLVGMVKLNEANSQHEVMQQLTNDEKSALLANRQSVEKFLSLSQ